MSLSLKEDLADSNETNIVSKNNDTTNGVDESYRVSLVYYSFQDP